jgi:hypothetical protein
MQQSHFQSAVKLRAQADRKCRIIATIMAMPLKLLPSRVTPSTQG